MLRTHGNASQLNLFDPFLPDEVKGLPAELAAIDTFLDDEVFFGPYRPHFDPAFGRPSIPIETYLRMMYLKFSWGLGYETLVKEVADSITWRRFSRIGLAAPVPHSTTLVKITRRVGPDVVGELNRALKDKARRTKLIRARSLRVDTTVIEADVSHPTDAGLLARSVGAMGRAVRRVKASGGAPRTAFRDRRLGRRQADAGDDRTSPPACRARQAGGGADHG
jgi:IS5 family transposase